MNEKKDSKATGVKERVQQLSTSLPFLFTLGALIFFVSFLISSFPLGTNPLKSNKVQRVYFADNIGVGHAEIIRQFNALHEGEIEVIPIDLPFTKFNTNQRKELIARNLRSRSSRIDIFSVDLIWVPRFTKWAEQLAPYFPPQMLDELLPQALQTCYVDDGLVAIPLYTDIGALYYRRDMILALPDGESIDARIQSSISWEELENLWKQYYPDQAMYLPQAKNYEGLICNFNEILAMPLQDPETGSIIDLNSPRVLERVEFFQNMFSSGFASRKALDMVEDDCIRFGLAHDIPFIRGWPTVNNENDRRFDPEKFSKLAIAPLPHFKGEQPTPVFGGWNMMISKHSPVKDAAITFMKFACSEVGQSIFYSYNGLLPIQKSFYANGGDAARKERLHRLEGMMSTGLHRPRLNEYTLISDILSNRLHQILSGELDSKTGMAKADTEIREVLHMEMPF
jgi:multiple sugar transport system substrate-binding protein